MTRLQLLKTGCLVILSFTGGIMPWLTGETKLAKPAKHALPENRHPTLLNVLKNASDKATRVQNEMNRESEALERLEAAKSDYWPTLQLNGSVQFEQINRQSTENDLA